MGIGSKNDQIDVLRSLKTLEGLYFAPLEKS